MFTGQAGQGEMLESTRLGAYTCLLKPFEIERLVKTLQQALEKKNGRGQGARALLADLERKLS
jgi:DNA-binding NtrC family response regulator